MRTSLDASPFFFQPTPTMADEPPAEEEDLPLNNEWTVWTNMRSQAGQSKEGWESSLVQLGNFTTINKFWEYCRFIHNHFEDLRRAAVAKGGAG